VTTASPGIVVVGLGACTAVGAEVLPTTAAVRAGISAATEHPFMIDKAGERMITASTPFLDPGIFGMDRLMSLALPAAQEALAPLVASKASLPISVVVGLPEPRAGLPDHLEMRFRDSFVAAFSDRHPVTAVAAAAAGHAGGLLALKHASELIASGKASLCLAGGVDSWIEPATLEWLDSLDRLHSETTRWGFCPGEAAGFCLVCDASEAERLNLPVYSAVLSASSAAEANHILTETVCIADGLTASCRDALACLPAESKVDHTICDMNGEPYRGSEYGFMMTRLGPCFSAEAGFDTPAQTWGDVGAASGPLFLILASIAAQKRYSHGPLTLLYTGSDSGRRSAALIQTPATPR